MLFSTFTFQRSCKQENTANTWLKVVEPNNKNPNIQEIPNNSNKVKEKEIIFALVNLEVYSQKIN